VSCVPVTLDQYRRTLATCSVGGVDLGEWLVRGGLALDWPQYSKGKYTAAQRDAEHAGRGIWAGSYVEPWLYRACIRANGRPADCYKGPNFRYCPNPRPLPVCYMIARIIVEILKAVTIIIGLPLVSGLIVEVVVFFFSNRDVEGAFASGAAGAGAGVFALIIGIIIVLRRVADFDFGD
jgi:hypothetical protein